MKKKIRTNEITQIGIFVAIMATLSQISIPIPISPVPLTLSLFAVFLSSSVLSLKCGLFVQIAYILLGLLGIPVFAGFKGGIGAAFGPTGGYILSYIFMAPTIFLLSKKAILKYSNSEQTNLQAYAPEKKKRSRGNIYRQRIIYAIAYLFSLTICYGFGTLWLMIYMKSNFGDIIKIAVIPYIPLDLLKIVICSAIVPTLNQALSHKTVSVNS